MSRDSSLPWASLWTTEQVRDWLRALAAAETADEHAVYADAYAMAAEYLDQDPPWPLSTRRGSEEDLQDSSDAAADVHAEVYAEVLADAEASLRAGRLDRALLVLAVWVAAKPALLSGEQTWAQQALPDLQPDTQPDEQAPPEQ